MDGLLGIKLQNNQNSFKLGIIANYLPPDSFHYGQDPEGYFNDLASMWQDFSDCDLRIGGGDLNARTKQLEDFIPEIDGNIPIRNKAFVGLRICDNVQTGRSIFKHANWPKLRT